MYDVFAKIFLAYDCKFKHGILRSNPIKKNSNPCRVIQHFKGLKKRSRRTTAKTRPKTLLSLYTPKTYKLS